MKNLRVRPPVRVAPTVVWSAILGVVSGVVLYLLWTALALGDYGALEIAFSLPRRTEAIVPVLAMVPVLCLALWFSHRCQRVSRAFLAGLVYCTCYALTFALAVLLVSPGATAGTDASLVAGFAASSLALGAAGGAANLGLLFLNRTLRFEVIEQDGTLCGECGHHLGQSPGSSRCPECGTPAAPRRKHAAWMRALRAGGHWVALGALGLLAGAFVARHIAVERGPTQKFIRAFDGADRVFRGAIFGQGRAWDAVGVYQPLAGRTGQVVMMLYDPTPDPGEPDMEVRLGTEWRLPNGAILPVDGTPIVLCDLNRAQSEWAIANGMPDSLVDELVKAATAVGWPTGSAQPVVVDAGPHFPALATDNTKTSRPALGNGGFPASPFRSARWGHSSIKLDRITALVYAIVLALSAPPLFVGLARLRRAGPGHRSRPSCGRCGRMIDGAMDGAAACPACNAALAEAGIWPPDRSRGSLVFAGLLWLGLALLLWAGMWALSERTPGAIAARERKLLSDPEVRRFVERFGDPQKEGLDLFLGPMSFTTPSGQAILWQGSGVYRILPDEEKLMGVMFHPRPPPGCPRMELYVELLHRTPQGALAKTRGMSPILCYLSDAQVEHAMEHGLPESLVQKLLETAAQTAAATGPGSTLPGTPTIVPADEHFPVR